MNKKAFILAAVIVTFLVFAFVFVKLIRDAAGVGVEGIYKIGSCYKNDEFGVVYKVASTAKGRSFGHVLVSEKYPSQDTYKVGAVTDWSSNEPLGALQPVDCPEVKN